MYSPVEEDLRFIAIPTHSAAVHVSFSPVPIRRKAQFNTAMRTDQEILLVGDDTGTVHIFAIEWPSTQDRDLFNFPGGYSLLSRVAVHSQQVCGIAWAPDGRYFATGGNDNLCCLYEVKRLTGFPVDERRVLRADYAKHVWSLAAAVKAIAFCPWQRGLLAVGGGSNDRGIHFYHTITGASLATIDCSAQITSLTWSTTRREIAATFGFAQPDHPYRIAVYSWPSCQQIVAVPWQDDLRALYAISYPGGVDDAQRSRNAIMSRRHRRAHFRDHHECCLVVAGSDGSIKFHEIWSDARRSGNRPLANLGGHGVLGGSEILEGIHGIDKDDIMEIR